MRRWPTRVSSILALAATICLGGDRPGPGLGRPLRQGYGAVPSSPGELGEPPPPTARAQPLPPTPDTLLVTEWKVEDLLPELSKPGQTRDLANGQKLFSEFGCSQCHKLGASGYDYGPNLTDLLPRWQGDRAGILREMLQPSESVSERYRNYEFELADGETFLAMILKEDDQTVTVQSGPADHLVQTLPKSQIKSRRAQEMSVMPCGLVPLMSKEQILNLFAYIEAAGQPAPTQR